MKNITIYTILILFASLQLLSCFEENDNTGPVDPKYFFQKIDEAVSPEKTRVAKIYEAGGSYDSSTQIIVGFGWPKERGGGGIFAAKGINLGIKVNWIDENNLMVTYNSGLQLFPKIDTMVQLFSEKVKIHYKILND